MTDKGGVEFKESMRRVEASLLKTKDINVRILVYRVLRIALKDARRNGRQWAVFRDVKAALYRDYYAVKYTALVDTILSRAFFRPNKQVDKISLLLLADSILSTKEYTF